MKRFPYIFALIVLTAADTTYAAEKAATQPVKDAPKQAVEQKDDQKPVQLETLEQKRQRALADLDTVGDKLGAVIERTQHAIDLLSKNGKDTGAAQTALDSATVSLKKATDTIAETTLPSTDDKKPAPLFKDQIKKIQDALKASRTALIESITALKDLVKDTEQN